MQDLHSLEIFEIETLELLNQIKALDYLYFGGGTMLRLCHNLNRYSTDLDFWISTEIDTTQLYQKIMDALSNRYLIRDAEDKFHTLLFEIQSTNCPRRLKIEIRKEQLNFLWERKIAFSQFSNVQVLTKGLTLTQMMTNKIAAFLSRKIIRDCYDIEFLLYRGISLDCGLKEYLSMLKIINDFTDKDYNVKLGSILEPEYRDIVKKQRFQFLKEEIQKRINSYPIK